MGVMVCIPCKYPDNLTGKNIINHYEKRKQTPPNLFSGFALGNNSSYLVAFVRYQNYEIFSRITLSVDYGLASRRYYLFNQKLQNSCASQNTLIFSTCQIESCYSQPEGFEKKDF